MIDRKVLLNDLKQQVKAVETDLGKQLRALPDVHARLKSERDQAFKLGRTNATLNEWLKERINQVAAAWVLGTVFVRFCEDNLLIPEPYLTAPSDEQRELALERYTAYVDEDLNPTYRGWLERAFAELGAGQAGKLLFNPNHNPLYQVPLSHDGARGLVEFWRERNEAGNLVHDFSDPLSEDGTAGWDTRFLGDLYQDLSEAARQKYALFQTPEFIEEFILERTMDPVVRELGQHFGELKMIDPTCGSGHFVLGAFRRIVRLWTEKQPHVDKHERVHAALDSVHGVDINPFAVAIARFRLLVAAMATAGIRTLADAAKYEWPIHLAVGDSLIKERQLTLDYQTENSTDPLIEFKYTTEDIHEHPNILKSGRYHIVAGNPPYPPVKDSKLNDLYRKLYASCSGTYALSVPFAERFFQLARTGNTDGTGFGMVGQITANSFMKREFGTKLIEEFFAHKVELTEVIDTSGAYIPGHATPTVILVGRRRGGAARTSTVRTVRSILGEPSTPSDAKDGLVWNAIYNQINKPGSISKWVSADDLERAQYFGKHPWILADGGLEMLEQIKKSSKRRLREAIEPPIGRAVRVGADSAYLRPLRTSYRTMADRKGLRPFMTGEVVRDWHATPEEAIWFPYAEGINLSDLAQELWPLRRILEVRRTFQGNMTDAGLQWWDYMQYTASAYRTPMSLMFAFVATHNHFTLDRGGSVFNRHAPVIKLKEKATENEHLRLLGLLNSSTVCFWLKQVNQSKGNGGIGGGISDELWEHRFEFTGGKLEELPLPSSFPDVIATMLDTLAQELSSASPSAVTAVGIPTAVALREGRTKWEQARARMIALQEDLDWQVYSIYGLHNEDLRTPETQTPGLKLGERAFEIVLARRVEAGEASPEWFKRHNSRPITEIPQHWPDAYRAVVQKRIDTITNSRAIGMIERPEYKRRWATEGWDVLQGRALQSWLLDRIERRDHWYQDDQPTLTTRAQLTDMLARDEDFVRVATVYAPRKDLLTVVTSLLAEEHVPFLAAVRLKPAGLEKRAGWEEVWDKQRLEDAAEDEPTKRKIRDSIPVPPKYASTDFIKPSYWRARGKLDVPKERFISYSTSIAGIPDLYGWAGWDHREQAQALTTYFTNHTTTSDELQAYLAGLLELQPWLDQWHGEFDALYGMSPAAFFAGYRAQIQGENGWTDDDLRAWRPTAPTRGRRAAKKKTDD